MLTWKSDTSIRSWMDGNLDPVSEQCIQLILYIGVGMRDTKTKRAECDNSDMIQLGCAHI